MGFISEELRQQQAARNSQEATERAARQQREIAAFCAPDNIQKVVEAIKAVVRHTFSATGGMEVSSAYSWQGEELGITQAVAASSECERVLLKAMRVAEPQTESVSINYDAEVGGVSISASAQFGPPLL